MEYREFFREAFGRAEDADFEPYRYQCRLAEEAWPDLLDVPTGMGKTAAVVLAWLWKRGWRKGSCASGSDPNTPRRLVYCLPMRVLVEQTAASIEGWLQALGLHGRPGEGKVSVSVLMGGEEDARRGAWAEYPEEDAVLVGTQDMLLSRALMRGYGMSRYQWPVQFALLHNDCLWVYDEVQLMGAGLATSAQLEAFRRSFPVSKGSRSLWLSATLNRDWLGTVDLKPHLDGLKTLGVGDADRRQAGGRLDAVKTVAKLPVALGENAGSKKGIDAYLGGLCKKVLAAHAADSQTIVILNRVDRAQGLFRLLRRERPGRDDVLVHARFRAAERSAQNERLRRGAASDRIVVATQAIEAGVDLTSRVLITELAPWPSMVQRFGRCNRYGEHNADGARILWIELGDDEEALRPYEGGQLAAAREHLANLTSASPQRLPTVDEARPLTAVLRRRDLLDLFNTDPDLSGFDVDVSDYVRDSGRPSVLVFWREFDGDPNEPKPQLGPGREELCPVPIGQAVGLHKRNHGAWLWDTLDDRWAKLDRQPRPGMTLLLSASDGGYDPEVGFDVDMKRLVAVVKGGADTPDEFGGDPGSREKRPVALAGHLGHVAGQVADLSRALGETAYSDALRRAGLWHDVGKAHEVFQRTMHACGGAPAGFLAKSACNGHHERKYFRHELASALAWLAQHEGEGSANLIAYIIAAHHGKVRMSLRAMPAEDPAPGGRRFARGIWEGDELPPLDFHGERSEKTSLGLALMELGEGEQGPSWMARTLDLLEEHGPFQLAWLEALLRVADWRASGAEQHGASHE